MNQSQIVEIERIDKDLPMPEYQTNGSVCFDVYSRESIIIKPREIALIPSNLIIKTPAPYMLLLASRSSMPKKKSLIFPHGVGIIDQDYCGEKDEILIQVYNISDDLVEVKRGERIAQAMFVQIAKAEFKETAQKAASRGGFGSTKGYEN